MYHYVAAPTDARFSALRDECVSFSRGCSVLLLFSPNHSHKTLSHDVHQVAALTDVRYSALREENKRLAAEAAAAVETMQASVAPHTLQRWRRSHAAEAAAFRFDISLLNGENATLRTQAAAAHAEGASVRMQMSTGVESARVKALQATVDTLQVSDRYCVYYVCCDRYCVYCVCCDCYYVYCMCCA
jgi:hypothetical protein